CGSFPLLLGKAPENSERQLQAELNHAGASRTEERIAGRDIGRRAPATERGWGRPGIYASAPTIRRAVRISDVGVIEDIKQLDTELGVDLLLEPESLENREIHVLEARVAEDVPAHRPIGASLGRNHNRSPVRGHVASAVM